MVKLRGSSGTCFGVRPWLRPALLLILLAGLWGATTTPSSARPPDQAIVAATTPHEGLLSADDGADRTPLALGRKVNSEFSRKERRNTPRSPAGKDDSASVRLHETALRQAPASTLWIGDHQQMALAASAPCFKSRAPPAVLPV